VRRLLLAAAAAALLAGVTLAQVPPAAEPGPAAPPEKSAGGPVFPEPDARDVQDVLFLTEARPMLLRWHVTIGGRPFRDAFDDFLKAAFDWYDLDGDGVLTKKEMTRIPTANDIRALSGSGFDFNNIDKPFAKPEEIDTDKDGKITREEFAAYLRKAGLTPFQAVLQPGRDGSGKLTKALFRYLDTDKDGKLSKDELAAGLAVLRKLDLDDDDTISAEELLHETNQGYYTSGGRPMAVEPGQPVLAVTPGEPIDLLARRMIARYDKDKNKKLSASEIGLDKEAFAALDTDGDGQLDTAELAGFFKRPPDLELQSRLGPATEKSGGLLLQPLMQLTRMTAKKKVELVTPKEGARVLAAATRPEGDGLHLTTTGVEADLHRGDGTGNNGLAIGVRSYYVRIFRDADQDKNGYVDRKELEQSVNEGYYLRGLFALADRDGDGKLYEKEFLAFLDLVELAGGSTLLLRVTDQGSGLFELMDADGDNRLCAREFRTAWSRLAAFDRNGDGLLAADEVPRFYQLSLETTPLPSPFYFAPPTAYGRALKKTVEPKGPEWFRKMDRNGDGDVSLREWLGSEEEFRRLDADGDGLISAEEAEKADAGKK
jgi:Ca2+-binding EF-hand superfamily protein